MVPSEIDYIVTVSTHSRPKAAAADVCLPIPPFSGFNTQPPEGGCSIKADINNAVGVSTHSRPKAAAANLVKASRLVSCFNTQPPEGGCSLRIFTSSFAAKFQHTAARRRLLFKDFYFFLCDQVSTHSRPKAAAEMMTNSKDDAIVSTHSRPKAAANCCEKENLKIYVFQHTAARRRLQIAAKKKI